MEHLPHGAVFGSIDVPCLFNTPYDGSEFPGYPRRTGWNLPKLIEGDLDGRTVDEARGFLQSWMYFGLLSLVFGPAVSHFDAEDFVRHDEHGHPLITSSRLSNYVSHWATWELQRSPEQRQERFDIIKACLKAIHRLAIYYRCEDSSLMISKPTRWLLSPEIHLSIILLADSLQHAGFQIFNRPFNLDWGSSPWLVNRMTRSGWCISAISTLLGGQQLQNLH